MLDNFAVPSRQLGSMVLVAVVALATGFVLAGQVKAQLLTPSNEVGRYQALVRSVQDLEATNANDRRQIAALRSQIEALEAQAAAQDAQTQVLKAQVDDLRAHAGLTPMHGPGIEVDLRNGVPGPTAGSSTGYLVNYQDVQDVVNLLFANGAEAIAVNGRRITPLTAFSGSAGEVVVDQGPPLASPLVVRAIGDRNRMEAALDDPSRLPDISAREVQYDLQMAFIGSSDLSLPAYDSSLLIPHVQS